MQIIISGVAGFIGSNLVKKLLEQDCHVTGIDNFFLRRKKKFEGSY